MKEEEDKKNIESKIEINPDKIKSNIFENKNEEVENEDNNKNKCCDCLIL